ncbi:MAG: CinA family protein [Clostridiales bacterium]|nr:CinA family protein [Clostridiales bacterium]
MLCKEKEFSLEERVVSKLKKKNWMITTAESCTGGLIGAALVNVAGASSVYSQGFITYSDEAKEVLLGVKKSTLGRYTAVSEQTAAEMAAGAAARAGAQVAIASTGIAGPGGGSEEQPVGLVFLSCQVPGETRVERYLFQGDRMSVRQQATIKALEMADQMLES